MISEDFCQIIFALVDFSSSSFHNKLVDRFIKFFEEASVSQKLLITGGFCAFLLFFMGASYLLTNYNINTASKNTSAENNADLPADDGSKSDDGEWEVYTGEAYKLSYPQGMFLSPGVVAGGGSALGMADAEGVTEYGIELEVVDSSQRPLEDIYSSFRIAQYKEEEFLEGDISAKKFSGISGQMHETAIIFENRGEVYKFQLSYQSETENPKIKQIFRSILATFSFI
ncbi:MAG: hypothetical protein AAB521_01075 [Patescibacteria group bacterium]